MLSKILYAAPLIVFAPKALRWLMCRYADWKNQSSVEFLNRKVGVITYTLRGNQYKLVVPVRTKPPKVYCILSEGEDVTDRVLPYCGPTENISLATPVTPRLLGYKELVFVLANAMTLTFRENEPIYLETRPIPPTIQKST